MWIKIRILTPTVNSCVHLEDGWGLDKAAQNCISERVIILERVRDQEGSKCGIRTDQKGKGDKAQLSG